MATSYMYNESELRGPFFLDYGYTDPHILENLEINIELKQEDFKVVEETPTTS